MDFQGRPDPLPGPVARKAAERFATTHCVEGCLAANVARCKRLYDIEVECEVHSFMTSETVGQFECIYEVTLTRWWRRGRPYADGEAHPCEGIEELF